MGPMEFFFGVKVPRRPQDFAKSPPIICPMYCPSNIIGGDFAKFCGLLRIYELYSADLVFWANGRSESEQEKVWGIGEFELP